MGSSITFDTGYSCMKSIASKLMKKSVATLAFIALVGCETRNLNEPNPITNNIEVVAPSGIYRHDPTHSTLQFSVSHLGLSNYIGRFSEYSIEMVLDAEDIAASQVRVDINPGIIRTDYRGDYKATHPESKFDSWEEDLAFSDKFFNSGLYPQISFISTNVKSVAGGKFTITGNLTLLGTTQVIKLEGEVIGSTSEHPFMKQGAVGFSIYGRFKRSLFGMDFLLDPPLIGDEITVSYEGEMHEVR